MVVVADTGWHKPLPVEVSFKVTDPLMISWPEGV